MKEYDFYIVPTPVGNLQDITLRALDVLKSVDYIACEDMRVTQKLLNHFDIKTKCISYHKFNEKERVNKFLEILKSGKRIALVSDAGTPLICDPGSILLTELRKNNINITALPGANAVITFLSQIPRDDEEFLFIGFLPKTKSQIEEIFTEKKDENIVFYDSPNRILNTLKTVQSVRPDAKCAVGRELTKIYEEVLIDDVSSLIEHFNLGTVKGEIAGMVFAQKTSENNIDLESKIAKLKNKGFKAKEIAVILSELYDINKNEVYNLTLK